MMTERSITLRHEVNGDDRRNLWARRKAQPPKAPC